MRRKRQQGPIVGNPDGTFSINLTADERATLLGFVEQLESVLESGADDPRAKRLFPVAYHNDPEKDSEYQGYMQDELAQSRAAAIASVKTALASTETLSEAALIAFMTVLNSLRLVLGTLLDVGEGTDEDEIDEDDPQMSQFQLYGYLGWLLEWTVSTLTGH